jgi:hypothetical protein
VKRVAQSDQLMVFEQVVVLVVVWVDDLVELMGFPRVVE